MKRKILVVVNQIKNRGVEDIMIVSVDGLTGYRGCDSCSIPAGEIQR